MTSACVSLIPKEQVINIFMELSALGIAQPLSSNILEFMKALPVCGKERGVTFSTPTDIITKLKSVDQVDVPYPMSWIDEERDISPWLGNVMQREAFNKLYSVAERVHLCDDRRIKFVLTTIKNQGEELVALNKEVERLQAKLEKAEGKKAPAVKKEPAAKKPAAAKKATAKKPVAKKAASKKEE